MLKNDCLNNIVNAERRGKRQVLIRPSSKVIVKFLSVMQRHGEFSCDFLICTSEWYNYDWRSYAFLRDDRFNPPRYQIVSVQPIQHPVGRSTDVCSPKRQHTFFLFWLPILVSDQLLTGYIGEFTIVDDHRSGKIVIQLNGRLNKTGVISPRFNVQHSQIESWVNLLLPARSFGYIILSTSSGILDHEEARRKNVGGKLLGYVY